MTEMPPMVPSASQRVIQQAKLPDYPGEVCRAADAVSLVSEAYRDGFTAGVQAERNSTDRDQINYDEGRRFERAAIVASQQALAAQIRKAISQISTNSSGYIGYPTPLANQLSDRLLDLISETAARALADHLSQTCRGPLRG